MKKIYALLTLLLLFVGVVLGNLNAVFVGGDGKIGKNDVLSGLTPGEGNILYVKKGLPGDGDGASWESAFSELSAALKWARDNENNNMWDEVNPLKIYVSIGEYKPAVHPGTNLLANGRNATFRMVKHVQLYGGFDPDNGIETMEHQRLLPTVGAQGTILKGEAANGLPAFHVVLAVNDVGSALMDGFTITGGAVGGLDSLQVDGVSIYRNFGSGVYNYHSSPLYQNVVISGNNASEIYSRGGGMFNDGASPVLKNVHIVDNSSRQGAGMYNTNGAAPMLTDVKIQDNVARFGQGAGIYNESSSPRLMNVLITGNSASTGGGMVNVFTANPILINVTMVNNTATNDDPEGGVLRAGIFNSTAIPNPAPEIYNSIIWGGINNDKYLAVSSLIEGKSDVGNGNISTAGINLTTIFNNPTSGDYRLLPCSPAINAGNTEVIPSDLMTDIAGQPRVQMGVVDIGAYEANGVNADQSSIANETRRATAYQLKNGTTYYGNVCNELIATVIGDGTASAVSGETTASVWIQALQPGNYVKRHYEIVPAASASTATGRITLYFTQQEFDDFNAVNSVKLPVNEGDVAGKSNLLIEKRSGSSVDGSGHPESYDNAETIYPNSEDIVWNGVAARWEVSVNVVGFSGFFVKTQENPLPLTLLHFTAKEENCVMVLNWITMQEENVAHFEIEESVDGRIFSVAGKVEARNKPGENSYDISLPVSNVVAFYRLKMVDLDGEYTYSTIVRVAVNCAQQWRVYPNPAKDVLLIEKVALGDEYRIFNAAGQLVQQGKITNTLQQISIQGLASGMYMINISSKGQVSQAKFIKE